jgi:DNA-binding beta-propeller fold protein YncE
MTKHFGILLSLFLLILVGFPNASSRIGSEASHMEVVATLSLDETLNGIALNEQTGRVYISDMTGFFVISSTTDEIIHHVPLELGAGFIAVNPYMNQIFVCAATNMMITTVLDDTTYSVVGELEHHLRSLDQFALHPTMNRIYISSPAVMFGEPDCIEVYDGVNFSLITSIEIPGSREHVFLAQDFSVTVNPLTNMLYAAYAYATEDVVYVIDCKTNQIVKTVNIEEDVGYCTQVNPVTGYLYTGHLLLDGDSLEELMQLPGFVRGINALDNLVICSREYSSFGIDYRYLYVYDGSDHELLATKEVDYDAGCKDVAVDAVTGKIYVVHGTHVSVIAERMGPSTHIVINEFELNPAGNDDASVEWVELYNPTSYSVNISGWTLKADKGKYGDRQLPVGTMIEAGGFFVFAPESRWGQWLANEEEWIELRDPMNRMIDRTPVKSDTEDDSRTWQRNPDGCDDWVFQESTVAYPPVASVGGPYSCRVDSQICFNGSGSYDPDGEIALYQWDFGDGRTGTGAICYHTYNKSGTFVVTLTVEDVVGSVDADHTTVTVLPSEVFPLWIVGVLATVGIGTVIAAISLRRKRKSIRKTGGCATVTMATPSHAHSSS